MKQFLKLKYICWCRRWSVFSTKTLFSHTPEHFCLIIILILIIVIIIISLLLWSSSLSSSSSSLIPSSLVLILLLLLLLLDACGTSTTVDDERKTTETGCSCSISSYLLDVNNTIRCRFYKNTLCSLSWCPWQQSTATGEQTTAYPYCEYTSRNPFTNNG